MVGHSIRLDLHNVDAGQPHADATDFSSAITKKEAYTALLQSLTALTHDTRNWVANTANTSSLLWHLFHAQPLPLSAVNWAGFYVLDSTDPSQLVLGPFHGKVACQLIKVGKGVCGTVAARGKSEIVPDVEKFPGHIACDGETKSEIVVPIILDGKVRSFTIQVWVMDRLTLM